MNRKPLDPNDFDPSQVPEYIREQFDRLVGATQTWQIACVPTTDKTGKPVYLVCWVYKPDPEGNEHRILPLAEMIEGNPFDRYNAPEGTEQDDPGPSHKTH